MAENEYQEDLFVDPCNLDKEWNRNGPLAMKWAEKSAQADYELKMAEQNYKIIESQIEAEIRSSPEDFSLPEKLTEAMVKMAIRMNEKYKIASEVWADAIRTSKILAEAKDAMKFQRRAACQGLTSLWVYKYGDAQRISREIRDGIPNQEDELDAHMEQYQKRNA
jgi:hypothetical protein